MKIEIDLGVVPGYVATQIADKVLKLIQAEYNDFYIKVYDLEYQFRSEQKPVFEKCVIEKIRILHGTIS